MSGVLAIALYYRLTLSPQRQSLSTHLFILCSAWGLSAFQIGRSLLNPMGIEGFDADARAAATQATAQATVQATTDATLHATLLENFDKLFQIVLKSHLPLPTFTFHFWNEHLLQAQIEDQSSINPINLLLSGLLTGIALFVAFQLLKKTPLFLSIYGLGSISMMTLFVFAYRGSTRHYGHLFILLLACLWLAQWSRRHLTSKEPRPFSVSQLLFTLILCVQAFSGIYAYCSDILFPFSASYQAAQILHLNQLDELPLLGIHQRPTSPLSGYLDRPIYYPESQQLGSFWDISYPEFVEETAIAQAIETFSQEHAAFIAILTSPLREQALQSSDLAISYLTYVGPSIVKDEAFYLYQVEQRP